MKRFPRILAAACAAVALSSSLALAADTTFKKPATGKAAAAKAAPSGAQMPMGPMGQTGGMGQMGMAALPPEKQEIARALMNEHKAALFPLHQSLYAKNAELEALNAAGQGDTDKAKTVIREIADLQAKMLTANGGFRARLFKDTGLSTPVMGHGMMGGGMMPGMMGGMKGGMMSGGMQCPMMQQMMGGMQHGAPQPADKPADKAADKPAAKADAHSAHGS